MKKPVKLPVTMVGELEERFRLEIGKTVVRGVAVEAAIGFAFRPPAKEK